MGTKNNPAEFDCYANAENDEPMFVLLARDAEAPEIIEAWVASKRKAWVKRSLRFNKEAVLTLGQLRKLKEARHCAEAMRGWREEHPDT